MYEWIVILTLHTTNVSSSIGSYDVETLTGFKSEETCHAAASIFGSKVSSQILNHKAAEGVDLDGSNGDVVVFSDCIKVRK